jgi:hypothetical protein
LSETPTGPRVEPTVDAVNQAAGLFRLVEPVSVAGLFALAIWLGSQLFGRVIDVMKEVELARIEVTRLMAEAVRQQAEAAGQAATAAAMGSVEVLRRLEATDIVIHRVLNDLERLRGELRDG